VPPTTDPVARATPPPERALDVVGPAATTCLGGLPHRSAGDAARFALDTFDIPPIPFLPRRSPAASAIARALVGVPGVTLGPYGTIAVDVSGLDPDREVRAALRGDAFAGFHAFLEVAAERAWTGPVLWHAAGPLSVGRALVRAGADPVTAFEIASRAVFTHLRSITGAVNEALPRSPQIVVLDEPAAADVGGRAFPLSPDESIDVLSSAMAVLQPAVTAGVRGGPDVDLALLLEAGPQLISIPADEQVVALAGYLNRFLRNGGWICWGAIRTDGPVRAVSHHACDRLESLWRELAARGCVPELLRSRCLLAPDGSLTNHDTEVAEQICRNLGGVAASLRDAASTSRPRR
jgi:hypothetical protein